MVIIDLPLDSGQFNRIRGVHHFDLCIKHFKNTLTACHRPL